MTKIIRGALVEFMQTILIPSPTSSFSSTTRSR